MPRLLDCRAAGLVLPITAAALLSACDLQQKGPPPSYQDSKLEVMGAISGPAGSEATTAPAAPAPGTKRADGEAAPK
jgi:hypothetical protein